MRRGMRCAVVLLAVLIVLAGVSYGAEKPRALKVNVGKLSGVVQNSKGVILEDVALRLMKGEKLVLATKTGKDGRYTFPQIAAGKYELQVGAERALEFEAAEGVKVCTLSIVVPKRENYAAGSLALTQTQWVWVGVGTAGAAAVSVPVAYNTTNAFGGPAGGHSP